MSGCLYNGISLLEISTFEIDKELDKERLGEMILATDGLHSIEKEFKLTANELIQLVSPEVMSITASADIETERQKWMHLVSKLVRLVQTS